MVTVMMIAETVGHRDALRERPADYSAVARWTREELPYAALAAVARRYRIPLASLASVIGLRSFPMPPWRRLRNATGSPWPLWRV